MHFQSLGDDQSREFINTQQRYQAYLDAVAVAERHKGSMSFGAVKGTHYLMRSTYDRNGVRKFVSLGPRSPETEKLKADFDAGKGAAEERLTSTKAAVERQALINKALGLGRVPRLNARILRRLDASELMRNGARLVGTNCIFAYEAAAGVRVQSDITTTEDIDILMDARAKIRLVLDDDSVGTSLLNLLTKIDKSFQRTPRTFQAANKDGFLVDLVKAMPRRPEQKEAMSVSNDPDDLVAAEIEGLIWHVNSPVFIAVAIDIDGLPVRIVAPDPVAFAVHKLWLSEREDRNPLKKGRDARQANAVAQIVSQYLPHIGFDGSRLKQFPREIVDKAAPMFKTEINSVNFDW